MVHTDQPFLRRAGIVVHLGSGAVLLATKPVSVPNFPSLSVTTGLSFKRSIDRVGAQLFTHSPM